MAVTTRLTWMQEKNLQNYFGGKLFTLLYKATVHRFSFQSLIAKCSDEGPVLIVVYSGNHVIGAYINEKLNGENAVPIIIYAFQETEISECRIGLSRPSHLFGEIQGCFMESDLLHKIDINLEKETMTINSIITDKLGLPQCNTFSFEECEVFRCEDILNERTLERVTKVRESLLSATRTYKPYRNLVNQVRILLLGPTGAGKSSFINSVKSIFRGYVTHQVLVGSNSTGISKKYRTYPIKDGEDSKCLPVILCDTMGLGEEGEGLCMHDIISTLKGHVPDRYQFNLTKPITPDHGYYIHNPSLEDRIHCVAFVLDANSVENLSQEMTAKIKRIRREVINCGVVYMALLTNVDSLDLVTRSDLIDIHRCVPVKSKVHTVHRELGFALSDILVVSNYYSEWELDSLKDVLILSVLRQMLWAADDYLEDLPCDGIKA